MTSQPLIDALGPYEYIIPAVATFICVVTSADAFHRGNRYLGTAMILWFVVAGVLSDLDCFGQSVPGEWEYGAASIVGFLVFASLPVIPVLALFGFYKLVPDFESYCLHIPVSAYIGLQVYRLSGSAYFYMYLNGTMTNYVGLQTGLLDMLIGMTALPLAWWVHKEGKEVTKVWVVLWSGLGLYDLFSAFGLISLNFIGWYNTDKELSYFLFYPISLVVLYQVPIAMAIHILFLTQYDRLGMPTSEETEVLEKIAAPDYGSTKEEQEDLA